jgi:hypothetical protein
MRSLGVWREEFGEVGEGGVIATSRVSRECEHHWRV